MAVGTVALGGERTAFLPGRVCGLVQVDLNPGRLDVGIGYLACLDPLPSYSALRRGSLGDGEPETTARIDSVSAAKCWLVEGGCINEGGPRPTGRRKWRRMAFTALEPLLPVAQSVNLSFLVRLLQKCGIVPQALGQAR